MMVEILIATSIITVSVLAAMAVTQKAVQVARQTLHTAQASFLLEEGAESAKILRDNNWTNISALTLNTEYYPVFSDGTWTLSGTPQTVGIFTRTVKINSALRDNITKDLGESGTADPQTMFVTVTVSWQEGGTTVSKSLKFYLADIFS